MTRYQKRLSGPILDRIDMHLEVQRVDLEKLISNELSESSNVIRERVTAARERQWRRFAEHPSVACNADMGLPEIRAFCPLDADSGALLRRAMEHFGLSARAYHRVIRLSRTIADLSGAEEIVAAHVAEAIQYQPRGQPR